MGGPRNRSSGLVSLTRVLENSVWAQMKTLPFWDRVGHFGTEWAVVEI